MAASPQHGFSFPVVSGRSTVRVSQPLKSVALCRWSKLRICLFVLYSSQCGTTTPSWHTCLLANPCNCAWWANPNHGQSERAVPREEIQGRTQDRTASTLEIITRQRENKVPAMQKQEGGDNSHFRGRALQGVGFPPPEFAPEQINCSNFRTTSVEARSVSHGLEILHLIVMFPHKTRTSTVDQKVIFSFTTICTPRGKLPKFSHPSTSEADCPAVSCRTVCMEQRRDCCTCEPTLRRT